VVSTKRHAEAKIKCALALVNDYYDTDNDEVDDDDHGDESEAIAA
jgi:hypothetical protein